MMVSLLRPGKNGNQILDLLDKVTTTFTSTTHIEEYETMDFDDEDESVEYEELSINF